MGVCFRTTQRTLWNDEMTVDDMTAAVIGAGVVVGYDEAWRRLVPADAEAQVAYHVSARSIIEWWEAAPLEQAPTTVGPPWTAAVPNYSVRGFDS